MAQDSGMANINMAEGSNMDLILQLPMAAGFALLVRHSRHIGYALMPWGLCHALHCMASLAKPAWAVPKFRDPLLLLTQCT
jgi:hypothetical protein